MTPEEKITELEAKVKSLEGGLDAEKKAHMSTRSKLSEATTQLSEQKVKLKDAEKTIATQAETIAEHEDDLAEAGAMIEELKKAAQHPDQKPKKKILTIDGEEYEFVSAFNWKGQIVTFEGLQENTKLARELVSEGVGDLKLVE